MNAGDVVADRFEIERLAGQGGMGEVYRARDRETGEPVALKMFRGARTQAARFAREAIVLSELRHPAIVRYLAHGTTPRGEPYLAMEWLEGEDLSTRLRRKGLTLAEALALTERIAQALAVAHKRGIVHRDLKPGNLFLADGRIDRARLIDFGIVRASDGGSEITHTGAWVGTPGYMAPEQARSERNLDARADVYALGCVLFKCLTGRTPFVGRDPLPLMMKTLLEEPPRVREIVPTVPQPIDDLVARMIAKAREHRPRDGAALAEEVGRLARELEGPQGEAALASSLVALTPSERVIRCLVVARASKHARAAEVTTTTESIAVDAALLRERVSRHRGELAMLADGSLLVTIEASGPATDQAIRAARCALALSTVMPTVPLAVVARPAETTVRGGLEEVLDRAIELLDLDDEVPQIHVDDVAAGLLEASFVLEPAPVGMLLRSERDPSSGTRLLLGRACPCVGRDRELATLRLMLDECVSEPIARAALVTAPAGIGKSRLRYEFLRDVRGRDDGVEVWLARGDPMSAGSPFGIIAPALRRAAGILDGEPVATRLQKLRTRIARHVRPADLSRVVEFIAEMIGTPSEGSPSVQLLAAREDPMLMGDQMRRAFEDLVAAECAAHPLLVVLEDLHWGDLPTVKLLDSTLRALHDRPLMVLALARPEIHEVFPRLFAERGLQEMRLEPLKKRAAEQLVRFVLGPKADAETVALVVQRSEGNAFYLEELIRAVASGRASELPETVLAMVQTRIEELDPEARRMLRAASIFGQVFWRGGVLALLGGDERTVDIDGWLGQLTEREIVSTRVEGRLPGELELVFRHALVRDAAYAMLTDVDRRVGHELAGEWLAHVGEQDAMVLAHHFELGGKPLRAVQLYVRAAEQALEGDDLHAAIARADRGIACGATGEEMGRLRILQAEALRWLGENTETIVRAEEALTLVPKCGSAWWSAIELVSVALTRLGDHHRIEALCELLVQLPEEPQSERRITAETALLRCLLYRGLHDWAKRLGDRIDRAMVRFAKDPRVMARAHAISFARARVSGAEATALREATLAVQRFLEIGDRRNACMFLANLGHTFVGLGRFEDAERALRESAAQADALGLRFPSAGARNNLSYALACLGKLDEAISVCEGAVRDLEEQGDRRLVGGARIHLAQLLLRKGELTRAEQEAREGVEAVEVFLPLKVKALAALAEVLRARGEHAEAREVARRMMELLRELGGTEDGESFVRLAHAQVLHASGDHDGALASIREARDRLLERAARLDDEDLKRTFLENVAENVRTLELARIWETAST